MPPTTPKAPMDRRGFLKASGAAAAFLAALTADPEKALQAIPAAKPVLAGDVPGDGPNADVLIRMQGDVRRALKKTPAERHWVMAIDLRKYLAG